jgi:hypothetical protein
MKKYMIRSVLGSFRVGPGKHNAEYIVYKNSAKYWFQLPQWHHEKGFASLSEATAYVTTLAVKVPALYFDENGEVL